MQYPKWGYWRSIEVLINVTIRFSFGFIKYYHHFSGNEGSRPSHIGYYIACCHSRSYCFNLQILFLLRELFIGGCFMNIDSSIHLIQPFGCLIGLKEYYLFRRYSFAIAVNIYKSLYSLRSQYLHCLMPWELEPFKNVVFLDSMFFQLNLKVHLCFGCSLIMYFHLMG